MSVSLGDKEIEGELIGLEREDEEHLQRAKSNRRKAAHKPATPERVTK